MTVGSKYHAIDKTPLGRRFECTLEITAYQPNKYIAAKLSPPTNATWETAFEEVSEGTRMTFKMVVHLSGLHGLMAPLFKGWANRQVQDGLNNFKSAAESP